MRGSNAALERRRVDPPLPGGPVDLRRLPGLADDLRPGDPERAQQQPGALGSRLLLGHDDDVGGVDPLRRRPRAAGVLAVPEMATQPWALRNSSICVTLRLPVHPLDAHGTWAVSGTSRDSSGRARAAGRGPMRRKASSASSQRRAGRPVLGPGAHRGELEAEVAGGAHEGAPLEHVRSTSCSA